MTITLGEVYRDMVTGFTGVATARYEYLNGCIRIQIQPKTLHEGKPVDAHIFDIEQLEPAEGGAVVIKQRNTGGDRDAPTPRANPVR